MADLIKDSFGEVIMSRVPNPKGYNTENIVGKSKGEIRFFEIDRKTRPIREITDEKELKGIVKSFNGKNNI